jgi:hypothetical protein
LTTTSGTAEATAPDVRSAIDRGFDAIEAAFRRQIQRAIVAGLLDVDTDAAATAKSLMLSFQGLLVLARSGAPDLELSIDETFRTLAPSG